MMLGGQLVRQKVIEKSVYFELIKVVNVQHFPSFQNVGQASFYVKKMFNSYLLLY